MMDSDPALTFRVLTDGELSRAHEIICEAASRLLVTKGVGQFVRPISIADYREQHIFQKHCGLFVSESLAAVVTVGSTVPCYWLDCPLDPAPHWISSLAVGDDFHGRGLGRKALAGAEECTRIDGGAAILLDCCADDDFLLAYYRSGGYQRVARKVLRLASGTFDHVLFRKALG